MPTPTQSPPRAPARETPAARIAALGAVAVVRLPRADALARVAWALHAGGVAAVEVTMTTAGALAAVESLAREAGDALLVGVGSVLDADGARRAVEAGARFVVSPVLAPDVVRETLRQGAAAVCGAFTPTEAHAAHAAGAELVKLFPADALGPAFLRGVLAPMPFLRVMPTGGVTVQSLGGWLRAGAVAVGLGSALVDPRLVEDRAFAALTERARLVAAAVAGARGGGA